MKDTPFRVKISAEQWTGVPNALFDVWEPTKMPLGYPTNYAYESSEQTLTAARPSRILTAFPFDYPEENTFRTCN